MSPLPPAARGRRTLTPRPAKRARLVVRAGLALGVLGVAFVAGVALAQTLGDVVMDRHSTANDVNPVIFPHWKHRIRFKCYACHPQPFEMQAGATDISMKQLQAGQLCAQCHDGRTAFPVAFDTCRTCHSGPVR